VSDLYSPRYVGPSHQECGWGRRLPDIESSCEYIEYAMADRQEGCGTPSWGLGNGLTTHRHTENSLLGNVTQGLGFGTDQRTQNGYEIWKMEFYDFLLSRFTEISTRRTEI